MKSKGSVNVFTSLIFLLVAAVITTSIRSVRLQASKVMVATSFSMAMDSTFAGYNRALFDEWGVLFLDGNVESDEACKETLSKELSGYLDGNLNVTDGLLFSGGKDLYGIQVQGIAVDSVEKATDEGGLLWMESVVEYERYEKVINLIASFLDIEEQKELNVNWGTVGKEMVSIMTRIRVINAKAKDLIQYIDGAIVPMNDYAYASQLEYTSDFVKGFLPNHDPLYLGISNAKVHGEVLLQIQKNRKDPVSFCTKATTELEKGNAGAADKQMEKLKSEVQRAGAEIARMVMAINAVYDEEAKLSGPTETLAQIARDNEEALGSEFTQGILEGLETLGDYTEILAEDIIDLDLASEVAYRNAELLNKITRHIEEYQSANVEQKKVLVSEIKDLILQYSFGSIHVKYEKIFENGSINLNWWETLKGYAQEGVFAIALPDDTTVSRRFFHLRDSASLTMAEQSGVSLSDEASDEILWKKIIYGEYVMDHFSNFLDEEEGTNLNYEVEYILCGKTNDYFNLEDTVNEIGAIRTLICLAYIMTDSDRKSIAEEYATSLMEWTENEAIIKMTKYLLLYFWCEREAASDCKILLSGEKVPLIKNDDNWQTGIETIATLRVEPDVEANSSGLKYEDYLRALLLFENDANRSAYTMNLIEGWMEAAGYEGFRFKNEIYSVSGSVLYTVREGLYPCSYSAGYSY